MNREHILRELKQPIMSQVVINTKTSSWNRRNLLTEALRVDDIRRSVAAMFDWARSPQGDAYWRGWNAGVVSMPTRDMWE